MILGFYEFKQIIEVLKKIEHERIKFLSVQA